jgi:ubiquinone/menaquinone biosynthesis C-methylase UbiE
VLAPGGQALPLDFNRPVNSVVRRAYVMYLTIVGGALGWLLHRDADTYRYIPA